MKKLKLCNVHKLAIANEGEGRKPIHIPFGTWAYDDRIDQTLDREHADAIAADLAGKIAAGEPGIPVYQGHPDVPEYAGKYPDKGALGWVKKILVNENGMDLEVEWDRDPGKGFGWFSPYWTGDDPGTGASGKKNVIVDGLTSIGLVNNPNIREFRLANEAGENLTQRRGEAEVAAFKLPTHLLDLAKRFDDRVALANVIDANGMGHSDENGQFDGSGSGSGGGGSAQSSRLDRMLGEARSGIAKAREAAAASRARRASGRAELEARIAEIRQKRLALKDFNDRMEKRIKRANEYDESKHPRAEDGKWTSGGGSVGGGSGGSSYGKKLVATRQAAVDAAQKTFDEAKSALIAGQKRGWSKEEDDKAFKAYDRAERKLKFAKSELRTAIGAPSISHEEQVRRDSKSVFRGTATKAERDRYMSELAKRFDERVCLANEWDESKHPREEDG